MIPYMKKMTTFSERIKELRKQKHLSQRELAERVERRLLKEGKRGFDFTYLSKIENGVLPPPSVQAIIHLAKELDADSDDLLALAEKIPPDVGKTLKENVSARMFYRSAMDLGLGEADWRELLEKLRERESK